MNIETTNMERIFSELSDTNIKYQTFLRAEVRKQSQEWLTRVDAEVFEIKKKICSWQKEMENKNISSFAPLKEMLPPIKVSSDELHPSTTKLATRESKGNREGKPSLRRKIFTQKIHQQLQEYRLRSVSESHLEIDHNLVPRRKSSASTKW